MIVPAAGPNVGRALFAKLGDIFLQNSIICLAASKSINLAGLQTSTIIIPDEELGERFAKTIERNAVFGGNAFGLIATEAAYNHRVNIETTTVLILKR